MKTRSLLLLIFIVLVTACTPQSVATPSPALISTNSPLATATPEFTQTQEPTFTPAITNTPLATTTPGPTHTPMAGFPLNSCANLKEAKISDTGVLEVIYDYRSRKFNGGDSGDLDIPTPPPWLEIQYNNLMLDTQFWFWNEDTQKTVSVPLPSDAKGPEISADHHWIVFRRDFGEIKSAGYFFGIIKSELWVIDINGQNEKKLATVSINELKTRNPNINRAILDYGWVPRTDSIYYQVELVKEGVSDTTYDAFMLVDIHSKKMIQLAQPGKAPNIVFAPDGSQAAVLTDGKLTLVSTEDGSVQFTLPIPIMDNLGPDGLESRAFLADSTYFIGYSEGLKSRAYSPDSKYLIGFSEDGIVRVNAKEGKWQIIPLKYAGNTGASGDPYYPEFSWIGDSTILIPIRNIPNPDANFTIWRINLIDAVALPVQSFTGYASPVIISPDGNYLVFGKLKKLSNSPSPAYVAFQKLGGRLGGMPPPNMTLADLNTGSILTTWEAVESFAWSQNSNYFIYRQYTYYVGRVGEEPIRLGSFSGYSYFFGVWVDGERFVLDADCEIRLITVGANIQDVTIIP